MLHVSPDGHGYIVYGNRDSVYVPMQRIRRMDLSDGDRLVVDVVALRRYGAHPVMNELRMRNGEEFDYSTLYNRPSRTSELTLQLIYYLVVSFIMLSILTSARRNYKAGRFALHCMGCLVAAAALYIFAPVREWHSGQIVLNFMSGHIFDYMLLLKCSFAVAVSMLYGWVYVLNSKQQAVVMENERLKNENLTTRYNMLVGQINPHFFFNSLNSLAMLVREKHDDKALTYIDQLSYTFRYIIQNGQSTLMTLDEELKFIEAYSYLFEIRYADKLFFDIDVDDKVPLLDTPGAVVAAADRQRRQTQYHNPQQAVPYLDPHRAGVAGGRQSQGAEDRTRTVDGHRPGKPAQPLAPDYGPRHRDHRHRQGVRRAHAAAKPAIG